MLAIYRHEFLSRLKIFHGLRQSGAKSYNLAFAEPTLLYLAYHTQNFSLWIDPICARVVRPELLLWFAPM